MAITINGSGTVTGITAGGLPDGSITADDLASTLDLSSKTLTIPTNTTNLPTVGYGAFSATFGSQTISNATNTKIAFSSELSDYDNLYDTTNYRYQPDVAGLYYINAYVQTAGWVGTSGQMKMSIYKNGARDYEYVYSLNTSEYPTLQVNTMIPFNGSTDYVEIYVYQDSGSSRDIYGSDWGQFEGYLVRAN